ncbi:MAG TPA: TRC40/GET3/ArsA family transport-energizing ATPase [Acidimicrobiales bacterium]|nr:TRC40/GET3/ArsA family transport-energizing ATPase [Acidimicrobiales bacterium]
MRILLFTGKGGVGKTSVAAATALRCADAGLRTLVLSTDPAHSLADSFDRHLGADPTAVVDRLYGQQLDATERLEEVWGEVQGYLMEVLDWAGLDAIEAEELSVVPGLDEVFSLSDIKVHADSGAWDVIVVDCAPTAETIRLLSLPDILSWYMDRIFPVSRKVTKIVRPLLRTVTNMPVAGDDVFDATRRFYDRLDGVRELLTDPAQTSVRLVVNPERMVIAEARRTATYLSLFGYRVDAVVANRLLPEAITDPWFKAWKEAHAEHLATIEDGFAPLPVLKAELASEELVGVDRLRRFADDVYGDLDPTAVLHHGRPLRVEKRGAQHILALELPFADRDELDVGRRDDELLVRVGPHRRAIVLPDSLRRRQVTGAAFRDDWLEIAFEEVAP